MAKPFESRIQDIVYNVDVGVGLRLIKMALYILFVLSIMLLYTATQFRGLRNAEAMEYAQLGRNFMKTGQLRTQVVRPASMWYLIENSKNKKPRVDNHPDLLHPPLYPMWLAAGFKLVNPSFEVKRTAGVFAPEQWVVIPLGGHLFSLLTGLLVWLLGRRMFDNTVGLLGMTLYYVSDAVWQTSISGTSLSMATFLVTAACYAALVAAHNRENRMPLVRWLLPFAWTCLFCIMAALTRYGAAMIVPALALYFAFALRPRGWVWAIVLLAVFALGMTPWLLRNYKACGGLFGLTPHTVLAETYLFPEDSFLRTLVPSFSEFRPTMKAIQVKWLSNMSEFYSNNLRSLGDGVLICFFVTTYFYRFTRRQVHLFRWAMLLGILLLLAAAGFFGIESGGLLNLFWPLVLLYGLAFFFLLLERLQLRMPIQRIGLIAAVILLSAAPLIFTLMPPRKGFPYPPYLTPYIGHVSGLIEDRELMCTDMPWATSWYGNRTSLLIPQTIDEFYEINDYIKRVSGIYFTTLTRDRPFVRSLLTGSERTWFPIQQGRMPGDFPLTQGFPLHNLDQLFITDRDRLMGRE